MSRSNNTFDSYHAFAASSDTSTTSEKSALEGFLGTLGSLAKTGSEVYSNIAGKPTNEVQLGVLDLKLRQDAADKAAAEKASMDRLKMVAIIGGVVVLALIGVSMFRNKGSAPKAA